MNSLVSQYLNTRKVSLKGTNGEKNTYTLFKKASRQIPAYKDFLAKNKIKPSLINNFLDFKNNVPLTTKENYINVYKLKSRCWGGNVSEAHTVAASSGSTGEPIFWPRYLDQEIQGAKVHELILKDILEVGENKTLIVNSFGLGNWIAGMYTEFCLYLDRLHGIKFTLASPGYNQEETLKIIKEFSPHFDQTIMICHPPVLKIMIESGLEQGINWKKLNMKFLSAGEGFSENWRDYLLSLVGQKDPLKTLVNIYGSADAGLIGFETPASIALRRKTSNDHKLNYEMFNSERNPYIYQYVPDMKFIESVNGEIVLTSDATAPLIRYNIHDRGGILNIENEYGIPFVYIFGRDHYLISLMGVNIYPENIKAVLEEKSLQPYLTGRFVTEKKENNNGNQKLYLKVELKSGVKPSHDLASRVKNNFVNIVKKLNSEYNQVESKFSEKMHPQVEFIRFQDPKFFPEGKIKKMS
jgi:phenylacetate-CoA ligase